MQGILISLATAVILAIGGAFAAPFVVDWNGWRGSFETELARALGLPVVIRGPIHAEILPSPRVVLRDVTLGDVVSTGGTVQELKAELSLGALMRGDVEATGMALVRPRIRLVLDSAGRIALPTGVARGSATGIARLDVTDGTLDILDRGSDRTFTLSDLTLHGEARSLMGPFRLDGDASAGGVRYAVKSSLGRIGADGSGRLRLTVETQGQPYTVEADGTLGLADLRPSFAGKASLTRKGKTGSGGEGLDGWRLSGTGTASLEALSADTLDLALGGADLPPQLTGSGRLTLTAAPALQAELTARSLDLDALRAATPLASPGAGLPAELAAALHALPAPGGTSRLKLAADQLMLAGTLLRSVAVDLSGGPAGWRIAGADAQLPGRAALRLSGAPLKQGASLDGFEGDMTLTADDPLAFLRWALPAGEANRPDPLRDVAAFARGPAKIAARVALQPDRIALSNLDASLGPSRITGALTAAPETGGYGLDLKLMLAKVDLDPVLPALRSAAAAAGSSLVVRLALQGQDLTLAGLPLKGLALDASARGGALRLGKAVLEDFAGLAVTASGRLERYATRPEGELLVTLAGPKADGLVPVARLLIGPDAADTMARLVPLAAPVKLAGTVGWQDGGGQSFAFDGAMGTLSGDIRFARPRPGEPVQMAVNADAADAGRVLAALGVEGLAPRLGPGKLRFSLDPLGPDSANLKGRLDLAGLAASAEGALRLSGPAAQIAPEVAVRMETGDLGRILPQAAAAGGNAPVPAALSFVVLRGAPGWRLEGLAGTLAGAPISGRLDFEPGAAPRLGGALAFDSLSLPRILGLWAVRAPDTDGPAAWSTARFLPGLISGVTLGLDLTARELMAYGPFGLSDARLRLQGDGTDFTVRDLSGGFAGGSAGLTLQVRRRVDTVQAEGRLKLDKVDGSVLLAPLRGRTPPAGEVSLSLDLGGSGRTLQLLMANTAGQGTLAITGLTVDAAAPSALDAVLAETAGLATPPDERRTAQMLERAFARGPLLVPAAEATISVVNGLARLTPTRAMIAPEADLPGPMRAGLSGSLDLGRLILTAGIDLEAQAAAGAPPAAASLAWRGPLAAPERRIGASALTSLIAMRAIERETRRLEERQMPRPPDTRPDEAPAPPAAAVPVRPARPADAASAPRPAPQAPASPSATIPPRPEPAEPASAQKPAPQAPATPPPGASVPVRPARPADAAPAPRPAPQAPASPSAAIPPRPEPAEPASTQKPAPQAPAAAVPARPVPVPDAAPAPRPAAPAAARTPPPRPAPSVEAAPRPAPAASAIERYPAPASSFGMPSDTVGSAGTASAVAPPPASTGEAVPAPHPAETVRRAPPRAERRPLPDVPVVRNPPPVLPPEHSLPPRSGFGEIPRPPGLVGQ